MNPNGFHIDGQGWTRYEISVIIQNLKLALNYFIQMRARSFVA